MRPDSENERSCELVIRRETEKFNECEICVKTTTGFSNLNRYCRIHTGEKPYKWDDCRKAFSDKSNYDIHYKKHGIKGYDCDHVDEKAL